MSLVKVVFFVMHMSLRWNDHSSSADCVVSQCNVCGCDRQAPIIESLQPTGVC